MNLAGLFKKLEMVTLVRDGSKLSNKVDKYIHKRDLRCRVFYSSKKDYPVKLPAIFSDSSQYYGEKGFKDFKRDYPKIRFINP